MKLRIPRGWFVLLTLFVADVATIHPAAEAAATKNRILGSATYRERVALTPNAVFEATLEDVTRVDAPPAGIARVRKPNPGQVPIAFELRFNPGKIVSSRRYVLRAMIRDGGRVRFSGSQEYVPTRGRSNQVTILMRGVRAVGSPAVAYVGMFRYTADAARFRDCRSNHQWPVAMSDDYLSLERAYNARRSRPGHELKVSLNGRIEERPKRDGAGTEPTLVVVKFLAAMPGETCEQPDERAGLENARWVPTEMAGRPVSVTQAQSEPWIMLEPRSKRFTGYAGCNRFSGSYEVAHDSLRFGRVMSTQMACISMETEQTFLRALRFTRRYQVLGRTLDLRDDRGRLLARLEERTLR
jgi:heat shock protein HslJ/uncharacterized lipoprotein YbaY